uniref:Cyclic nucleotide-binding domain-containing protein n=1 Tax=Arcella intermedia TaxID=1963864 RepID=A0A6B2L195_9EUKA
MTLIDEQLLLKVRIAEFLDLSWIKSDSKLQSPNVKHFMQHTGRITSWVITEILKKNGTGICDIIVKFIQIAKSLFELKNFNGLCSVLSGLHHACITLLNSPWGKIPSKDKKTLEELSRNIGFFTNFESYAQLISDLPSSTSCIPIIDVVCSSLSQLDSIYRDEKDSDKINWEKHQSFAKHIWSVKRFIRSRYILHPIKEIQQYLLDADIWEGKPLADVAKLRESSFRKMEKVKDKFEEKEMTEKDWELLSPGSERIIEQRGLAILGKSSNQYLCVLIEGELLYYKQDFPLRTFKGMQILPVLCDDEKLEPTNDATIVKYKRSFIAEKCLADPALAGKLYYSTARQFSSTLNEKSAILNTLNSDKVIPVKMDDELWEQISKGMRSITYKKGDLIIIAGDENPRRIYILLKGSCRIEKETEGRKQKVTTDILQAQFQLFGEICFFLGGPNETVIADENNTSIGIIEAYYLTVLFETFPPLAGRFYYYMSTVIAQRRTHKEASYLKLKQKSKKKTTTEKSKDKGTKKKKKDPKI